MKTNDLNTPEKRLDHIEALLSHYRNPMPHVISGVKIAGGKVNGVTVDDHHERHDAGGEDALTTVPDHDHTGDTGDGGALSTVPDHDHTGDTGDGGLISDTESIRLLCSPDGLTIANPGTSYTEADAALRFACIFDTGMGAWTKIRLRARCKGNEEGNDKGIEVWHQTDEEQLCEITWDGNTKSNRDSGWVTIDKTGSSWIQTRVKACSASEDITIYFLDLFLSR